MARDQMIEVLILLDPADVNECLTNPCSQECANLYGSYQCYCLQGYHLREDGHSCEGQTHTPHTHTHTPHTTHHLVDRCTLTHLLPPPQTSMSVPRAWATCARTSVLTCQAATSVPVLSTATPCPLTDIPAEVRSQGTQRGPVAQIGHPYI